MQNGQIGKLSSGKTVMCIRDEYNIICFLILTTKNSEIIFYKKQLSGIVKLLPLDEVLTYEFTNNNLNKHEE